jgi:hypothetical protein
MRLRQLDVQKAVTAAAGAARSGGGMSLACEKNLRSHGEVLSKWWVLESRVYCSLTRKPSIFPTTLQPGRQRRNDRHACGCGHPRPGLLVDPFHVPIAE